MSKDALRKAIRSLVSDMIPVQTVWGKVKEVSQDEKVCDVESLKSEGFIYNDVMLSLDPSKSGVTEVPEVGSKVLIGLVENLRSAAWVMWVEKVDHVKIHGDQYGGLIKIQDLVTAINKLENNLNAFKTTYNSHVHPVPALGTSGAAVAPATFSQGVTQVSDLENKKVKHG